jgi:hypothetical protein
VTYCLIQKVEVVLDYGATLNLIGYRTEENRLRIQRATEPDVTVLRGTEAQRLRKTRCTHIIQESTYAICIRD